jgi:hypothetical protein
LPQIRLRQAGMIASRRTSNQEHDLSLDEVGGKEEG